ncbi:uncharacterized protein LOC107227549 isoform X1 [Neodiprion lecontei]|uniref:Uncharacterized protein LOC107227549 isoform X1 n=1 Tax=Neodiprion lecontei TaxID=441921 RepID=A0ABM3FJE1_NEOLC|nr:uncharacterized protein LOC107227549 isoform X1 [Neodiprion lecontei]
MWSKGVMNVTRLKCLVIILGLNLTQGFSQNAEPGEKERRNGDRGEVAERPYDDSGLMTTPGSFFVTSTQRAKQPFDWEAFSRHKGMLEERKELLPRSARGESEVVQQTVMPQGSKKAGGTFSTSASPAEVGKSNGEDINETTTLLPPPRKRSRNRGGERRRRLKQFLAVMSRGNESNAMASSVSGGPRASRVNTELNSVVRRPKKDRLNTEHGRPTQRRKSGRTNSGGDKELKEARERRKRLRMERRRRRARERRRRNKIHDGLKGGKGRRNRKQKEPANAEHNATDVGNVSRVTDVKPPQGRVSVNQQRDEALIPEPSLEEGASGGGIKLQDHREQRPENVEREFSKQFERELSRSAQPLIGSRHMPQPKVVDGKVGSLENLRFAGEKILGYSRTENELPSDDANNEVFPANHLEHYRDYVTNGLLLAKTSAELRGDSFPENSKLHPETPTFPGNSSESENSVSNGLDSDEVWKTDVSELKGDLSCINGTFLPAPLSRNALIKYVKSSTPGHEYLEADYECTPGYSMTTKTRRLLCNNRRWIGDMPRCKPRRNPNDVCADSPCDQVCREVNGTPTCACYKGFRQQGSKCIDVNECEKGNGGCEFICLNTPGSYRCECPKGMRQGENRYTCMDINECLLNNGHGPCQDTCRNFEGGYGCSCEGLPGTVLGPNNHTCQDAGPCGTSNAGCSHTCLSTMGRVFCLCPDGFMLEDDWKTCQDVDECAVPDLQSVVCQHGCINTPGSYRCSEPSEINDEPPSDVSKKSCEPGFEPSVNHGCVDINECSFSNGGCSEVCENTVGSYFCACNGEERLLSSNGKTCLDTNDVSCPILNPSGRGYVMCSRLAAPQAWRGRKRMINRPGTKCFLKCPYGYQLRGEYELTCGTDGNWLGSRHGECVRYSKPRLDCPPNFIAEVPPGQSEAFVTFAQPSTDLDWFRYVRSEPAWGTRLEANLTPGKHAVTFTAKHPVSKKQTTCTLDITVKPGEAPRIKNCPENIVVHSRNSTIVTWTEPVFTDNVNISNVVSNENPGASFPVGDHKIHYEASDEAGWTATCDFLVTIRDD